MGTFGQAFEQAVHQTINDAVAAALRNQIGPFLQQQLNQPRQEDGKDLLDTAEAAEIIGVRPFTLVMRRHKGQQPAYIKVGGAIRYRRSALQEFMVTVEPRRAKDGRLKLVLKKAGRGHGPKKPPGAAPGPVVSGAVSKKAVRS